mmetsp:Transcript_7213/g.13113  ORF Transcript_7213/g.13113 Transcript_7213/m.13113 type:complete len:273 (-) Transcript_7213:893-1711(-)
MDTTTTPTSTLFSCTGSTSRLSASFSTTKANSPPPESSSPVFTLSGSVSPNLGPRAVRMPALNMMSPNSSAETVGRLLTITPGSTEAPVVRKNSASRIPRKGARSASICVRKFVSASSSPATKAPSVSEKPTALVSSPVPTATSSTSATKVSFDLAAATKLNTIRSTDRPAPRMRPSTTPLFSSPVPTSATCSCRLPRFSCSVSIMGSSTSSGTMARSWNSRTPSVALANCAAVCPFSCRIFSTKAELDSASAAPITKASSRRVMLTSCSGD